MAPGDAPEHLAGGDIEGGIEIRGAVPLVVVGAPGDLTGPQREHRMGPVEGLDLRLLVLSGQFKTISGHRKSGHFRRLRRALIFTSPASCVRKLVWSLVRQLRGPHLSTCA